MQPGYSEPIPVGTQTHTVGIFGGMFLIQDSGLCMNNGEGDTWTSKFSNLNNTVLFFKEKFFEVHSNWNSGINLLRVFSFACHDCWGEEEYQTQKRVPTMDEMNLTNLYLDWPWGDQMLWNQKIYVGFLASYLGSLNLRSVKWRCYVQSYKVVKSVMQLSNFPKDWFGLYNILADFRWHGDELYKIVLMYLVMHVFLHLAFMTNDIDFLLFFNLKISFFIHSFWWKGEYITQEYKSMERKQAPLWWSCVKCWNLKKGWHLGYVKTQPQRLEHGDGLCHHYVITEEISWVCL